MRLVSPLLKRALYPALHRTGVLRCLTPMHACTVVNYHGVFPSGYRSDDKFLDGNLVWPETLRKQLQLLQSHYQVISPEDLRDSLEQGRPLPPRSILITCDDGLLNNLTDMLPVVREQNVQSLFFVTEASCSDHPGMLWYEELYHLMRRKPLDGTEKSLPQETAAEPPPRTFQAEWWNTVRRASQLTAEARSDWMAQVRSQCGPLPANSEKRWRLLNRNELKQLAAAGMTIGAHTRTHPILSLASDDESRREISSPKAAIENALGQSVWAFAYPFGNPATIGTREFNMAKAAGYSCAFLNVEHWTGQESNPFAIPRTHVTADMALPEFAAHISGVHARLQRIASA